MAFLLPLFLVVFIFFDVLVIDSDNEDDWG
jgi:hypothetical protein